LAEHVNEIVGYLGSIRFDASMADRTPRKLLDIPRLRAMGWEAKIPLSAGIRAICRWFLENHVLPE